MNKIFEQTPHQNNLNMEFTEVKMANKNMNKCLLKKCKLTPQLDPTTHPLELLKLKRLKIVLARIFGTANSHTAGVNLK